MSFTAVLWGILGFLVGFLSGSAWRAGRATVAAPRKKTPSVPPKARTREQWIGPVVVVLAVLMGAQYMVQVNRERDYTTCQAEFNSAFGRQLSIRSELASRAQANVDQIILSIGRLILPEGQKTTVDEQRERASEYRSLFTEFAKESAEISKKRTATPLPKLPDCGGSESESVPAALAVEQARVEALEAELDASREAILAAQAPVIEPAESKPTQSSPVRTVVVREKPDKATPPPVMQPPVVVTLPAPEVPATAVAEPSCVLNLLGICVDL